MSHLHMSSRVFPRVCMPTLQCKSRLGTGYFLFMWCGALLYKGTLRFGPLCLSGCWVWCCGLVLGWPFFPLGRVSCKGPPPYIHTPSFKASKLGPCGTDAWSSRPHKEAPHMEAWRSFVPPFIILLSEGHFSSPLDFLFLLQLWKVCLCDCTTFSSMFPLPLCFPLWLRRWGHNVQRWVGIRVQRSPPSFLSTPTRRPFHSSLPDSWGLLLVWAFPSLTVSYPKIQSAHRCHKKGGDETKGLIYTHTTEGSVLIAV